MLKWSLGSSWWERMLMMVWRSLEKSSGRRLGSGFGVGRFRRGRFLMAGVEIRVMSCGASFSTSPVTTCSPSPNSPLTLR